MPVPVCGAVRGGVSTLWELVLPAIERAAVVIQAPSDVLAGLASSLASQLPQVRHRSQERRQFCGRDLPALLQVLRQSCGSWSCQRSSAQDQSNR
ncbi:protein of unknown function [Pseudomonas sp. JV241A]|nr:protein of unknown function [Pseudomonas sp. JV241A]